MNNISIEIKMYILTQLTVREILNISLINNEYNNLCNDECLWYQLVKRDFGNDIYKYHNWAETY